MVNAKNFYEVSVARQRKIIKRMVHEARTTGDPVIMLPFDTYPVIEEEMAEDGWMYTPYNIKETGKKAAAFYPKQYEYSLYS